ncbi:interleukin-12 subunit beta [Thalassophryne amazonica]|uniref:interleukin-12 subunit beta n=1 Tax=Thalassophryne amazonica TaxID=390379 RepID=UPI0014722C1C|nr:interleukin-12 subunit beta [Thalassophryne amazonica]
MCVSFLMVLLVALYHVSAYNQQVNIGTLMDNVLVLRVPHNQHSIVNVPLTCGEAYQNQPVFWKKNDEELNPALKGNQVSVVVEEMDGGNFTCHLNSPNGQYLNHTLVLIQPEGNTRTVILEEQSPEEGHIHCTTPNYKGSFHCSWTRKKYTNNVSVLLVNAERSSEKIPCELEADGSGIHCQDTGCPFKEEQHRIFLTIYIRSFFHLEVYTKAFYLREIVRPARLENLRSGDDGVFIWEYPETWEKPSTYFGLLFQIKIVRHRHSCHSDSHIMVNTTEVTQYKVNIKTKKFVFCVRAQDKYTNGPWSHWIQYTVDNRELDR